MAKGDHLCAFRPLRGYWHHGIDLGDGTVVHYAGALREKENAVIRRSTFREFAKGSVVRVIDHDECDPPALVASRALGRLGENGYSFLFHNCEHFAVWCKTGRASSRQLDLATIGLGAAGAAALVASAARRRPHPAMLIAGLVSLTAAALLRAGQAMYAPSR